MHPQADQDPDGATRSQSVPGALPQVFTHANLELRPAEFQALVDRRRVGLTVREFQVLHVLAEHEDRVVRRAEVYRRVWGGEMKHRERAVDVFVRKVRHKLIATAPSWVYIHTHFGIGYRFTPEALSAEHPSDSLDDGWSTPREPTPQDGAAIAQGGAIILRG